MNETQEPFWWTSEKHGHQPDRAVGDTQPPQVLSVAHGCITQTTPGCSQRQTQPKKDKMVNPPRTGFPQKRKHTHTHTNMAMPAPVQVYLAICVHIMQRKHPVTCAKLVSNFMPKPNYLLPTHSEGRSLFFGGGTLYLRGSKGNQNENHAIWRGPHHSGSESINQSKTTC